MEVWECEGEFLENGHQSTNKSSELNIKIKKLWAFGFRHTNNNHKNSI